MAWNVLKYYLFILRFNPPSFFKIQNESVKLWIFVQTSGRISLTAGGQWQGHYLYTRTQLQKTPLVQDNTNTQNGSVVTEVRQNSEESFYCNRNCCCRPRFHLPVCHTGVPSPRFARLPGSRVRRTDGTSTALYTMKFGSEAC